MPVSDGVIWNEALPDNSTLAHQIDDYNRDVRVGVRSRMAREHIWPSSQTGTSEAGFHQFITFQQQTGAPTLLTANSQVGALYVGSSGDGYPLVFENSAGSTTNIVGTTYGIMQTLYPVGSLYISTLSTNPNTLLGFGTWAAFAEGRVLVGNGTSDAAYTAGSTGGESTHILITAEMPAHTHVDDLYSNGTPAGSTGPGGSGASHVAGGSVTGSTGGDGAHNNLQPYVVVYIWERTA